MQPSDQQPSAEAGHGKAPDLQSLPRPAAEEMLPEDLGIWHHAAALDSAAGLRPHVLLGSQDSP